MAAVIMIYVNLPMSDVTGNPVQAGSCPCRSSI